MSLHIKQETPDHIWGVWKIEETVEELLGKLNRNELYEAFLTKATSEKRKTEWLAVRVLLKELIGQEEEVSYWPSGAPYLKNSSKNISISHTKEYVAVSIREEQPTGIDIEYRSERVKKIKSRFLSPGELQNAPSGHELDYLLICWCAKETLFKVIGQEDVDFREHLHIASFPVENAGLIKTYESRTTQKKDYDLSYIVTSEFTLTYY